MSETSPEKTREQEPSADQSSGPERETGPSAEPPVAEDAGGEAETAGVDVKTDRRVHERFELRRRATVTPIHDDESLGLPIEGRFVDVSRGGACLRMPNMMHPGSRAVIRAPASSGEFLEAAEVRWTRYESGVGTLVGFRFDRSPLAQELISRFRRDTRSRKPA